MSIDVHAPKSAAHCGIAVMGKASIAGRAKTRLVPPLSTAEAARFNTAFLQDAVANLACAGRSVDVASYIAYGPAGSEQFFRDHLPSGVGLIEACAANFGDCLFQTISALESLGHESMCVLNSDSPTLPTEFLVRAARALRAPGDRAVLGPSCDGGYYLLGLKRAHRRLFDDIDWSTDRVARQTQERARELGLEVVLLESWYDIDDASALISLEGELLRGRAFRTMGAGGFAAPHTRSVLEDLVDSSDFVSRLEVGGGVLQEVAARRSRAIS